MADGDGGSGSTGVVAVLVIFIIVIVLALVLFGGRLFGGGKSTNVDVKVSAPSAPASK